jgi:MFS family permease
MYLLVQLARNLYLIHYHLPLHTLRLLANGIQAGTFTVANLYYNHPILNILAEDFNVSYEKVSTIPTVMQAGYAAGLLFLNPLGDVFRRRAFVLILVWFTATVVSL